MELEDFLAGADFDEEEAMEALLADPTSRGCRFGLLCLSPVDVANQTGGE